MHYIRNNMYKHEKTCFGFNLSPYNSLKKYAVKIIYMVRINRFKTIYSNTSITFLYYWLLNVYQYYYLLTQQHVTYLQTKNIQFIKSTSGIIYTYNNSFLTFYKTDSAYRNMSMNCFDRTLIYSYPQLHLIYK